jgi:hypothetical protein
MSVSGQTLDQVDCGGKLTYGSVLQQNHTCRRRDGSGGDFLFMSQSMHSSCVTLHGLLTLQVLV